MWWTALIQPIAGFFKDRAAIKKAKVEGEIQIIKTAAQNVADWEKVQARASATSWKDEYWTILWSIPMVMAFVKIEGVIDGPQIAHDGFMQLTLMPEWYQYTLVAMVLASFGIRIGTTVKKALHK